MQENQTNLPDGGSSVSDRAPETPPTPSVPSVPIPGIGKIATQVGAITDQVSSIRSQVVAQGAQVASQIAGTVASGIEQAKGFVAGNGQQAEPETNFVTMETEADRIRRKNLFYVSAFIGFVWMLFHFTVVYFFGIQLGSAALVGVFLGFGNLVSLLLDIPVAALQKYFSAKQLYVFSGLSMLAAWGIFLKFIYASQLLEFGADSKAVQLLEKFFDSGANLLLLVVASGLYGIAKEINDLTTLSYILNNADPSEYGSIVSKNNIFSGGGSLLGLVSSGFILAINPTVAVLVLVTFIVLLLAFILTFFDNSSRTVDFSTITKLKIVAKRPNPEKLKEYAVGYLSKTDFAAASKGFKFVFLKPMSPREPFSLPKMVADTKSEAANIRRVLAEQPLNFSVLWAASVVLAFGFWDTFATSFLIEHLGKVAGDPKMAYVLLGVIAIPAFVTQDFFIKLSQKIGVLPVVTVGIVASGFSMVGMSAASSVSAFLTLGIVNSLGYAAGMGISQGMFLDTYNAFYAKKFDLKEIDSNASASPMKIIQNLANVVGLCLGGLLLAIFGFAGFFVVFGLALVSGAVASVVHRKKIAAE